MAWAGKDLSFPLSLACTRMSRMLLLCLRDLGAFEKLRKATISFVISFHPSVCPPSWNNSAPTGRMFIKFDISGFFKNLLRKFKCRYNQTKRKGTLHEYKSTFFIISRSVLFKMRHVSEKPCRENQNTHFMFANFFPKIIPFMRKCGKILVERSRPEMTIRRMLILYWISKATKTHTEVV